MSSGSRRTLSPRVASAETMISPRFKRLLSDNVTTSDGRVMPTTALLHLDQGISVTSHASQGKTVDNVIVSAPVAAFAQVSQAQLYVSMSRARRSAPRFFVGTGEVQRRFISCELARGVRRS